MEKMFPPKPMLSRKDPSKFTLDSLKKVSDDDDSNTQTADGDAVLTVHFPVKKKRDLSTTLLSQNT
jgi:hypothetical protein